MKLFERHTHREASTHRPEAPERLPELPEGVTVPDDLSGLEFPASLRPARPATGIRWMRWLPLLVVVLAAGALTTALLLRNGGSEPATEVSSYQLVQESIDAALAANRPAPEASAYQLIQESIDAALEANR